jgi:hypothetical protein
MVAWVLCGGGRGVVGTEEGNNTRDGEMEAGESVREREILR